MQQSNLDSFVNSSQMPKRPLDDAESPENSKKQKNTELEIDPSKQDMDSEKLSEMTEGLDQNFATLLVKLTSHLNTITQGMETRLSKSIQQGLKELITTEVNTAMDSLKKEFKKEQESMQTKINELETKSYASAVKEDPTPCKMVIKNFAVVENEEKNSDILKNNVNAFVKEGLKIKDPKIKSVIRQKSKYRQTGIVVVTCESEDEKKRLMDSRTALRGNDKYKRVWLDNWYPQSTLSLQHSFRTVMKELGKENDYHYNGPSVSKRRNTREDPSAKGKGRGKKLT